MAPSGKTRKRIALVGQSLTMVSIGVSLGMHEHLEVLTLDRQDPGLSQELLDLEPDAMIYDLGAAPADFAFSLLREHPDLLLIGVDAAGDKLLVLSGQQAHAVTTPDLVKVIDNWPGSPLQPSNWQVRVDRLRELISRGVARLRARPRQQKIAFGFAAIAACAVLGLGVSILRPQTHAPLFGAAVGKLAPELAVTFAGGMLLGALLLWLAMSRARRRFQWNIQARRTEERKKEEE